MKIRFIAKKSLQFERAKNSIIFHVKRTDIFPFLVFYVVFATYFTANHDVA